MRRFTAGIIGAAAMLALGACGDGNGNESASAGSQSSGAGAPTAPPEPAGMTVQGQRMPYTAALPEGWELNVSSHSPTIDQPGRIVAASPQAADGRRGAIVLQHAPLSGDRVNLDTELASLDRSLVERERAMNFQAAPAANVDLGNLAGRSRRATYTARGADVAERTVIAKSGTHFLSLTLLAPADLESTYLPEFERVRGSFRAAE